MALNCNAWKHERMSAIKPYQVGLSVRVVTNTLAAVVAVELPDEDEHEEDDDDQDDRDGDADQDGRVVGVSGDGLGPGGLWELVQGSVGADLEENI